MTRRMFDVHPTEGVHLRVRRPMIKGPRKGYVEEWCSPAHRPLRDGEYVQGYHTSTEAALRARDKKEADLTWSREAQNREPLLKDCLLLRNHVSQLRKKRDLWPQLESAPIAYTELPAIRSEMWHLEIEDLGGMSYNDLIGWLRAMLDVLARFNYLDRLNLREQAAREEDVVEREVGWWRDLVKRRAREEQEHEHKRVSRLKPLVRQNRNPLHLIRNQRRFTGYHDPSRSRVQFLCCDVDVEFVEDQNFRRSRKPVRQVVRTWYWEVPDAFSEEVDAYFACRDQRERKKHQVSLQKFGRKRKAHRAGLDTSPCWKSKAR